MKEKNSEMNLKNTRNLPKKSRKKNKKEIKLTLQNKLIFYQQIRLQEIQVDLKLNVLNKGKLQTHIYSQLEVERS
jgi:hypothetical protein